MVSLYELSRVLSLPSEMVQEIFCEVLSEENEVIKNDFDFLCCSNHSYDLLCHAYDVFRNDLLNSVNAMLLPYGVICPSNEELLKVILFGHEQLSFDSNTTILRASLEYIHISKRFE